MKSYFNIAIQLIPQSQLQELFASLGYDAPITADLCEQAFKEYGQDFGIPFGNLAKDAFDSDIAKAYFAEAERQVNKATDEESDDSSDKEATAYKWCTYITDTLINGASTVKDVMNSTNGTSTALASAQLAEAQATQAAAEAKTQRMWIIAGIVLVIVIIVAVMLIARRK